MVRLTIFTTLLMLNFFGGNGFNKKNWMNYILLWTSAGVEPFKYLGEGQETFIRKKCPSKNCFVTDDKEYFKNTEDFDIILFNVQNLNTFYSLPLTRAAYQGYVFVSSKSAMKYPLPAVYDGVFNWTWTYRLDSDVIFSNIIVKNKRGDVVGPMREMHWLHPNKMNRINKFVKRKLRYKKTAIAWIRTDCYTGHVEDDFALQLINELSRYELTMDIYGQCAGTDLYCSNEMDLEEDDECGTKLQTDYYFYLAIEDALSEDYVTEKIMFALNNYAVPVVYGGANYSRYEVLLNMLHVLFTVTTETISF